MKNLHGKDRKMVENNIQGVYLLIGFPASGKSTFLAALTSLLNSYANEMKLQKRECKSLEGFHKGLQEQAQKWSGFEEVARTFKDVKECVGLDLKDDEGNDYHIEIPDVSGELYDDMINKRFVDRSMQEKIREASVILFFINLANSSDDGRLLTEFPKKLQRAMEKSGEIIEIGEYDEMMFQSKVIELLQLIRYIKQRQFRVKILLSAWDILLDEAETVKSKTPMQVMQEEFPMIYQFVHNNNDWLMSEIWGVSAQGCDLNDHEKVEKLSRLEDEINRIIVIDKNGTRSCDLSEIFIDKEG